MTQEEKAKRYEQTLERAREAKQNTESAVTIGILEEIFPELRESEDEGMKKELIKFLQECHNIDSGFFSRYCEIPFAQMLAWLEKQGEPTEINPSEFDLRLNKLLKQFETLPKEELISNLSYYLNVIQNDGTYKIEKQDEKLPVGFYYVNIDGKKFYSDTFKYGDVILHVEKQGEQKLAWSEEDEAHINSIIDYLLDYKLLVYEEDMNVANGVQEELNWLESLKQKIGG